MKDSIETKHLALDAAALKFDADSGVIEGYGSVFGGVDAYNDTVVKGAYARTISDRQRPIHMRFNHRSEVIGKWLEVLEDDVGLYLKGQLTPEHSKAKDVLASLKHGAIDGLSIGYRIVDSETKGDIRYLKEVDLVEVSIVEAPADLNARVTNVKSEIQKITSFKDAEKLLRDEGGFSWTAAKSLVSRVRSLPLRDGEEAPLASLAKGIQQINL